MQNINKNVIAIQRKKDSKNGENSVTEKAGKFHNKYLRLRHSLNK